MKEKISQLQKLYTFTVYFVEPGEIWKEIPGTDGNYFVSNTGKVASLYYNKPRILKPQKWGNGYLAISINGKKYRIHRLVAQAFLENPEDKPEVHHKNHDKTDNRLCNLEYTTHKENLDYYFQSLKDNESKCE